MYLPIRLGARLQFTRGSGMEIKMGYLFAMAAVLCGAVKGFCGKKISGFTSEIKNAAYLNFIRMLACIFIGFFIVLASDGISGFAVTPKVLLISVFSGIATPAFVISWLFAVRRGAYMLVDVFLTVCVIVPMLLSAIFFDEKIMASDVVGLILLFAAALFLSSYSSGIKNKIRISDILLLTFSGTANGLVNFAQKLFINNSEGSSASVFNFYTYVFSAAVLALFYLIISLKNQHGAGGLSEKQKMPVSAYGFILVMAACLFGHSFLNTLAANELSAAELYPLSQGAALILSTAMASVFFGEKIKPRLIIGIVLAFAGLLVMNLLSF